MREKEEHPESEFLSFMHEVKRTKVCSLFRHIFSSVSVAVEEAQEKVFA